MYRVCLHVAIHSWYGIPQLCIYYSVLVMDYHFKTIVGSLPTIVYIKYAVLLIVPTLSLLTHILRIFSPKLSINSLMSIFFSGPRVAVEIIFSSDPFSYKRVSLDLLPLDAYCPYNTSCWVLRPKLSGFAALCIFGIISFRYCTTESISFFFIL